MRFVVLCVLLFSIDAFSIEYPVDTLTLQTSEDYYNLDLQYNYTDEPIPFESMNTVIATGRRNLQWFNHINSFRETPLEMTTKDLQRAYPIENPSIYGPSTIFPRYNEIKQNLPQVMYEVLFNHQAFTDTVPVSDEEYLAWARVIDKNYQSAVRWKSLSGWKYWYKENRKNDVQGIYYLLKNPNHKELIENFFQLSDEQRYILSSWLENICVTGNYNWESCSQEFNRAVNNNRLMQYYNEHFERAKGVYESYFKLDVRRSDYNWASEFENILPFQTPSSQEVVHFLKRNIEDEWRLQNWQLRLIFTPNANVHIVFKPNVTPNVNGLGGNRITMNSDNSLYDYNTQWTIRHEFGHVLGFPDCYVEYYDEANDVFVNYQIDISNLMCSRRGTLKHIHYSELKRIYN